MASDGRGITSSTAAVATSLQPLNLAKHRVGAVALVGGRLVAKDLLDLGHVLWREHASDADGIERVVELCERRAVKEQA